MYKVSLLDVIKSKTKDDGELRDSVKGFFVPILAVFLLLDVIDACLLFAQVHGWQWSSCWSSLSSGQELLSFKSGTFDCVVLALLRAAVLPLLTWAAVRWGRPRYDDSHRSLGSRQPTMVREEETEYLRLSVPSNEEEVNHAALRANLEAGDEQRQVAKKAAQQRKYTLTLILTLTLTLTLKEIHSPIRAVCALDREPDIPRTQSERLRSGAAWRATGGASRVHSDPDVPDCALGER